MKLKIPKTERRKNPDSKVRRVFRRVVIIAVTLVLLALAGLHIFALIIPENAALRLPEDTVADILTPVQTGFASVVDGLVNYLYKVKMRSTLEFEYNRVKQENEQLVYQAMLAEELRVKLAVYENLYDEISVNEGMNPMVATVIGREPGNYFSGFTINKGARDGIEDYMAVTMDGALVGYTYNVSGSSSSVRTIIDSEASIAALISSTRDQGTVRGTLGIDGQPMCRMFYLSEHLLPRPGDMVVTSGIGISFPKGIPIGTVRESTRGMDSNKQFIVVEPQANFLHIEYVVVLRYKPLAGEIENRTDGSMDIQFTPLESVQPIPTIQIGSDFYQLTPTLEPSASPEITDEGGETPEGSAVMTTTPPPADEYQIPGGNVFEQSYGYTLPPTPTPTPTVPPLDFTVEED